ncbi:MAG: YbaN family protein, partial [Rikenellaceae bacterium]|nr:YbaN family protein [Rikenellaceae bacterium]
MSYTDPEPEGSEKNAPAPVDPALEAYLQRKKIKSRPLRWLLIGCGCITLGLGLVGIPLPVLPTTPFLLLSAWCFGRSSERLLRWLLTNRMFGEYLRNYVEDRGIPRRVKVYILLLLWGTILFSAFVKIDLWWLRILLL